MKIKRVVAWDFDDTLNESVPRNPQECPVFTLPLIQDSEEALELFPAAIIYMPYVKTLKFALGIMQANGVENVNASQRIVLKPNGPQDFKNAEDLVTGFRQDTKNISYEIQQRSLFESLNYFFGSDRDYLTKVATENLTANLDEKAFAKNKNALLDNIKNKYKLLNQNIILVDDAEKTLASAADEEYSTILATKGSSDHIFAALTQTVRLPDIFKSLKKLPKNAETNQFKIDLITYQLKNLKKVHQHQVQLINEETDFQNLHIQARANLTPVKKQKIQEEQFLAFTGVQSWKSAAGKIASLNKPTTQEIINFARNLDNQNRTEVVTSKKRKAETSPTLLGHRENKYNCQISAEERAAEELLLGLTQMIMDCKWELGLFGGTKIKNTFTDEANIVPKTAAIIFQEVAKATQKTGPRPFLSALDNIEKIFTQVLSEKRPWYKNTIFNRQHVTTANFYNCGNELIQDFKKSLDSESPTSHL